MKAVTLITLHGMGEIQKNYYQGLESSLRKTLAADWGKVCFKPVQYQPTLQKSQEALWDEIRYNNDLDNTRLRRFFLYYFSDATSMEHGRHRDRKKYIEIQKCIAKAYEGAYREAPGRPVVIVAHSLGCQVISNYIWDAWKKINYFENFSDTDAGRKKHLLLKTTENLVTTGCNIPLFVGGLKHRKCFKKPNPQFEWDNFWDADDVLGWPMAQLDTKTQSYADIVTDRRVDAGNLVTSWNFMSHSGYWEEYDVYEHIGRVLLSKMDR